MNHDARPATIPSGIPISRPKRVIMIAWHTMVETSWQRCESQAPKRCELDPSATQRREQHVGQRRDSEQGDEGGEPFR